MNTPVAAPRKSAAIILEVHARHGAIYFEHNSESFTYAVQHQYHSQKFTVHFHPLTPNTVTLHDPRTGTWMGRAHRVMPVPSASASDSSSASNL
jgi:hypothetical protein